MDLVIEARAFVRGALSDVEIGIDTSDGRIVEVRRSLPGSPRMRIGAGKVLLPSAVDWHVHLRDPGHPKKEDFGSGTLAAAWGGVGYVLDMPNTVPVVDRVSRLNEKADVASRKAHVDWGLWATLTPQTPDAPKLLQEAVGAKLYLAPTTGINESPDDAALQRALSATLSAGRWAMLHAESPPRTEKPSSLLAHHESRSSASEVAAIERVAALTPPGGRVHIAHVTTGAALDVALASGFSAGATPQHMLVSHEGRSDARFKVNPPLRTEPERRELFDALAHGRLPHLETDHAPHTLEEKRAPIPDAPSGMPGVETMLPVLLRLAKQGDIPLEHIVGAACERPASDLGIPAGRIEPGLDASFFVVDLRDVRRIRNDDLHGACGWSAFEGMEAIRITDHWLRGQRLLEDAQFVGRKGQGRRIRPSPVAPHARSP